MLFSCKIANSILGFLDRHGADLGPLYDEIDLPAEFLKDPSYWLEADRMENFLATVVRMYPDAIESGSLLEAVGHDAKDLRSWGVLDSVLRMMQSHRDIYAQPERLLSYFVHPAPPIGSVVREHVSTRFELPVGSSQYPNAVAYLRAALEGLPSYAGKPLASVTWDEFHVNITWSESQASLFGEVPVDDVNLNPELLQNLLVTLEQSQKQLEETNRQLVLKDLELQRLRSQSSEAPSPMMSAPELLQIVESHVGQPMLSVLNDVFRLNDYLSRAQQLITLLVSQGRQTSQVQEAMRRVDWGYVLSESPVVAKSAAQEVKRLLEWLDAQTKCSLSARDSASASSAAVERAAPLSTGTSPKMPPRRHDELPLQP